MEYLKEKMNLLMEKEKILERYQQMKLNQDY